MNPVVWGMILACGFAVLVQMYWAALMTKPGACIWEYWDNVNFTILFVLIAVISLVISKRLGYQVVRDLGVAAAELSRMHIALRRLDPLQSSGPCIEWLKRVDDLQHTEEEIKVGYDRCGLDYLERLNFSYKAEQMLNIANDLLKQGDTFLHPKNNLRGTMNFHLKEVIGFIKATSDSGGLMGIWGRGGVGKSSLLKLVLDSRPQYDNGTLKVMFVCAGITCTVAQVQKAIATSMRLRIERNESSQEKIIHEYLSGRSFLLLLDDLWGYLDLEAVGIPTPLGVLTHLQGGLVRQICRKVVLTTRTAGKCIQMGCLRDNTIQMKSFAEEDVLELCRSGWPEAINGVDAIDEATSSSSSTSKQLAWPHLHTVRDVQPRHPQDLLLGMADYHEKVCCFIEAEGPKSLLLGVWGMRGVGKTNFLRLVRDSYTGNECFDHIMFVGAGTGCVVTNVQLAIAIYLGLDQGKMLSLDELSRANHIFDYLEHKSFLLLLDDIREPLNWWAVGLPLSHQRQKIILATRNKAACALMGCHTENTIEMQCLGKDDAWNLFRDTVGLRIINDHPQVHRLAEQMVSRCGGLPLALCALGRAMSNKKDPREWRSACSRFMDVHLEPCEIDDKAVTSILSPSGGATVPNLGGPVQRKAHYFLSHGPAWS